MTKFESINPELLNQTWTNTSGEIENSESHCVTKLNMPMIHWGSSFFKNNHNDYSNTAAHKRTERWQPTEFSSIMTNHLKEPIICPWQQQQPCRLTQTDCTPLLHKLDINGNTAWIQDSNRKPQKSNHAGWWPDQQITSDRLKASNSSKTHFPHSISP